MRTFLQLLFVLVNTALLSAWRGYAAWLVWSWLVGPPMLSAMALAGVSLGVVMVRRQERTEESMFLLAAVAYTHVGFIVAAAWIIREFYASNLRFF